MLQAKFETVAQIILAVGENVGWILGKPQAALSADDSARMRELISFLEEHFPTIKREPATKSSPHASGRTRPRRPNRDLFRGGRWEHRLHRRVQRRHRARGEPEGSTGAADSSGTRVPAHKPARRTATVSFIRHRDARTPQGGDHTGVKVTSVTFSSEGEPAPLLSLRALFACRSTLCAHSNFRPPTTTRMVDGWLH